MKHRKYLLTALAGLGAVAVIAVGGWLASLALRSDRIVDQVGIWPTATPFSETQISDNSVAVLAASLKPPG